MKPYFTATVRTAMLGAFAISLAACEAEEVTLEPDAEDLSGGEFITTPVDAEGVEVNLPEVEMTPVTEEEMAADDMEPAAE